ncbi:MAG: metallophosphoesterase family protein [Sedimentisphaerales bacterium]|nr:metallophosphoesterase family protein [Sedimentisphaerales bacterium]
MGKNIISSLLIFLLVGLCGEFSHATETTLVSAGSDWRYLDDGSDQGTAWKEAGFVGDLSWDEGPAQLGYGDGDEATTVSYGPSSSNKYITTYFRHTFEVADASLYQSLIVNLLRDDGAVVYLNGSEILRDNITDLEVTYSSRALSAVSDPAEDTFYQFLVEGDDLVTGTNVLAVEIHQVIPTSSDISLDLSLIGSTEPIPPEILKGPYLIYPGSNTEMTVLWQINKTYACTISWGLDTSYTSGSEVSLEYGNDHQHKYNITNLIPGTKYYYRVDVGGDFYDGSFRSAPAAQASTVKFMAYGDTRTNVDDHDAICAGMLDAIAADPNYQALLLHVGDWVSNGDTESSWTSQFFNLTALNALELQSKVALNGCMGNHEESGSLYVKYWPYPYVAGRYWSFDYGPAHFAIVDQYTNYSSGSAQLNWLEDDLSLSEKKWKFVVIHEPGWSAGGHDNNISVQTDLQPLFETYGVNMVFAGHNHYYARAEVEGVTHITTGGGGAPLYDPTPGYPYIVLAVKTLEFCSIKINENQLDLEVINQDGVLIDSLTILRGDFEPRDLKVDLVDFNVLADHWLNTGCGNCGGSDLNGDGQVDMKDLFEFFYVWLETAQ